MTWREEWNTAKLRAANGFSMSAKDWKAMAAMDAHVRDIEAKLCRARDDFQHIAEYWSGHANPGVMQNALEEIINTADNALSSTARCSHEEKVKQLKEDLRIVNFDVSVCIPELLVENKRVQENLVEALKVIGMIAFDHGGTIAISRMAQVQFDPNGELSSEIDVCSGIIKYSYRRRAKGE